MYFLHKQKSCSMRMLLFSQQWNSRNATDRDVYSTRCTQGCVWCNFSVTSRHQLQPRDLLDLWKFAADSVQSVWRARPFSCSAYFSLWRRSILGHIDQRLAYKSPGSWCYRFCSAESKTMCISIQNHTCSGRTIRRLTLSDVQMCVKHSVSHTQSRYYTHTVRHDKYLLIFQWESLS